MTDHCQSHRTAVQRPAASHHRRAASGADHTVSSRQPVRLSGSPMRRSTTCGVANRSGRPDSQVGQQFDGEQLFEEFTRILWR